MKFRAFVLLVFAVLAGGCAQEHTTEQPAGTKNHYESGKPYTRWWWFAQKLEKPEILHQLKWLKAQGFGGVEIAFIYPVNRNPEAERTPWLSSEWTKMVSYARQKADSLGLGCDFTFGTLWPFGGTFVPDSDATQVYGNPDFRQPLRLSWTHPDTGNVIDHLDRGAFRRYARKMGQALRPALQGAPSALFCDSWEVETRKIWTDHFAARFKKQYGYDIRPFMDSIYAPDHSRARYDYMTLAGQMVTRNFYRPFTQKAHALNAFSRVQCAGSPADPLNAYAAVDVPESEAMLYEPGFAQIPASAALLSRKPVISAETFTCLYGFPDTHFREEYFGDLKMVADALFANGVNQIIWHGKPYNPAGTDTAEFYATVHVGPTGALSNHLRRLNSYMTRVSKRMQKGVPWSDVAVYLPVEDNRIRGEYPDSLQMPWSWGAYEMRYVHYPRFLQGYQPHWINAAFLEQANLQNKKLHIGDAAFRLLYVGADYVSQKAVERILELAQQGFPVIMPEKPDFPGKNKPKGYDAQAAKLYRLASQKQEMPQSIAPLITGTPIPDFRARRHKDTLYVFFPHPKARNLKLPLPYRFSETRDTLQRKVHIRFRGHQVRKVLHFPPYQSQMVKIYPEGQASFAHMAMSLPDSLK